MAKKTTRSSKKKKRSGASEAGISLAGHPSQEDLHALRLLEELDSRLGIDVTTIDLGIRAGHAVARGVVTDQDELDEIEATVAESGGIEQVECLVQIAPNRREEDRDRARSVLAALERNPDLAADDQNLQIACIGRKVVLRGHVTSEQLKVKAGLLCLRLPDVARIRNRLLVSEGD